MGLDHIIQQIHSLAFKDFMYQSVRSWHLKSRNLSKFQKYANKDTLCRSYTFSVPERRGKESKQLVSKLG
jgi:hypothetical protein